MSLSSNWLPSFADFISVALGADEPGLLYFFANKAGKGLVFYLIAELR